MANPHASEPARFSVCVEWTTSGGEVSRESVQLNVARGAASGFIATAITAALEDNRPTRDSVCLTIKIALPWTPEAASSLLAYQEHARDLLEAADLFDELERDIYLAPSVN